MSSSDKIRLQKHPKTPDKGSLILFRILLILFSLVLVVLIEVIFRLVGYGHDLSLFIESERDPSCWEMSRYASYKFFTDEENTTIGYNELFKKEKAADTYRIFVLGESTTIGFPYMSNGSFHRWLKYRLMFTFPEKKFEIINLSLTAVNSYTVLDFAHKIVKYQPDAVFIYVGHNEYYGALGVGSTSRLGTNPLLVRGITKLRNLRLFQFMNNEINHIRRAASGNDIDTTKSLMVRMPANKEISLGSKEYKSGIRQFQNNMEKTLSFLSAHKIPVLISNLVSNEKDMEPFISDTTNKDNSAIYQYNLAKESYNHGEYAKAKELFVHAKELDLLRFRAPESMNNIILLLSKKYPGIFYVDSKSYFEEKSAHGVIGQETLLEHVHPNLYGYALMSDAFFDCLKRNRFISDDWGNAMSFDELLQQMPVTIVDSLRGEYAIKFMKNSWPFTQKPLPNETLIKRETDIEKLAYQLVYERITWIEAMNQLRDIYKNTGNLAEGLKVSEAFVLEYPLIEQNHKSAASFSLRMGDKGKAAFYISKAFNLNPNDAAAKQLSKLYLEMDEPGKAVDYLVYLNSNDENKSKLTQIIEMVKDIGMLKKKLKKSQNNIDLLNGIALNYIKIGQVALARKYLSESLKINKNNPSANLMLEKIEEITKTNPQTQD